MKIFRLQREFRIVKFTFRRQHANSVTLLLPYANLAQPEKRPTPERKMKPKGVNTKIKVPNEYVLIAVFPLLLSGDHVFSYHFKVCLHPGTCKNRKVVLV